MNSVLCKYFCVEFVSICAPCSPAMLCTSPVTGNGEIGLCRESWLSGQWTGIPVTDPEFDSLGGSRSFSFPLYHSGLLCKQLDGNHANNMQSTME